MITLLNGEQWQEEDILKRMDDDSFYYGHLGKHALSSSSLKKLLQSPRAYRASLNYSESSQALRDGRLIHMSVLEPHKVKDLVVIEGTKAKKEYKEAVEEYGEHMVATRSEMDNAYWIADAIAKNNEAQFLLQGCDYEVAGVDMIQDLAFRAKADAISKDRTLIVDLKTTSANVDDWRWEAKKYTYNLQAALYMQIFGATDFIFLVINKSTKDIGIFECSEEFIKNGQNAINFAIDTYKYYFRKENSTELINNYVFRGIL